MIDTEIINQLTSNLSEYNPSLNSQMLAVNQSLLAIGYILLSIFFMLEMLGFYQNLRLSGGGITIRTWLEVGLKYLFAFLLVTYSSQIFDAILWLTNAAIHMIAGNKDISYEFVEPTKGNVFFKNIIKFIGVGTEYVTKLTVSILVMLRFIEMYLLKAIAPVIIAFFMSDSFRQIAKNIIMTFAAVALQGVVIIILCAIYPAIVSDDLMKVSMSGAGQNWLTSLASIAKGVIFIIILVSSLRRAKSLLNVMG